MNFNNGVFAAIALSAGACFFVAPLSNAEIPSADHSPNNPPETAVSKASANFNSGPSMAGSSESAKNLEKISPAASEKPSLVASGAQRAKESSSENPEKSEVKNSKLSDGTARDSMNLSVRKRRDLPWVSEEKKRAFEADSYIKALRAGREPKAPRGARPSEEFLSEGTTGVAESKGVSPKLPARKKSVFEKFMGDWQPELSADKFNYADDKTGTLVGRGNAKVYHKNFELNSDVFEFSQEKGTAKASGDVAISLGEIRAISEDLFVDMAKSSFSTGTARFGTPPAFVESPSVSGDKKKIETKDARIWFGEPTPVSLNVGASSVSYDSQEDYLRLEDVTFKVGDIPFMYVPYYGQKGLKRPPFDVWNNISFNSDYGVGIGNTVFYNGLGDIDPGILLDYYTKRSVLFGPAVRYDISNSETWLKGIAQGAYINDHGSEGILGTDSLGRKIESDRFFVEVRHAQMIGENIGFVANIDYWSDEFVTRDFRDQLFWDNQTPDNFGEVNYYGSFYTASLFTRFAPNDWENVQQRLPEIRLDMQPNQIFKTGIYQTGFASYAMLRNSIATPLDTYYYKSNRVDAYYGVYRPINLTSWSTFTPVAGARMTYYGNAIGGSGEYVRILAQVGFDAQMDIYGTFDVKSETLGIDGIRHHMTPMISYRYIPNASQGSGRIPVVDDFYYYNTYPPIFDLGTLRNTDRIYNTNTLRFGIMNVFETRDEEYGSREIARFDVFQDINFDGQPLMNEVGLQSYSDLYINASVSPSRWLTAGVYARIDPNHIDIPELNTYVTLYEGDELSLTLATTYLQGYLTQYWATAEYRITENYALYGLWAYDYRLSMFTDQTYALRTRVANSYIIEYRLSYKQGSTRQNDFTFGVRFTINLD